MTDLRVAVVVGTRPEAIKMAPVYRRLCKHSKMNVRMIATGQHEEMLGQVFKAFCIEPDYTLGVMRENQTPSGLTSRVLTSMQGVLEQWPPDIVLVHGDATTCLGAALAAFYAKIPIGHVEAGLRTYDFQAPWPEEMTRRLVDPISRWCFAPTESAADNLRRERIPEENIFVTGNTVIDALFMARDMMSDNIPAITGLPEASFDGRRLILVTGHRCENFGKPFEQFCFALRDIVEKIEDAVIVYPVHLNPNVREPAHRILRELDRIFLIPPIEYHSFVYLMDKSCMIITDSGGIQEEAPSLGKPVLITREVTERSEAVERGLAIVVGNSRENIVCTTQRLLSDAAMYAQMTRRENLYGDGKASERILDILLRSSATITRSV